MIPAGRIDPISARLHEPISESQPARRRKQLHHFSDRAGWGSTREMAGLITPFAGGSVFRPVFAGRKEDVRPAPLPGLANGGDSTGVGFEDTEGASVGYTRTFIPGINEIRVGFNHVHVRRGLPGTALFFRRMPAGSRRTRRLSRQRFNLIRSNSGYRRVGDPRYAPTLLASQERQIRDVFACARHAHHQAGRRTSLEPVQHLARGRTPWDILIHRPVYAGRVSTAGAVRWRTVAGTSDNRADLDTFGLYNRQHVPSLFVQDDWKVTRRLP